MPVSFIPIAILQACTDFTPTYALNLIWNPLRNTRNWDFCIWVFSNKKKSMKIGDQDNHVKNFNISGIGSPTFLLLVSDVRLCHALNGKMSLKFILGNLTATRHGSLRELLKGPFYLWILAFPDTLFSHTSNYFDSH